MARPHPPMICHPERLKTICHPERRSPRRPESKDLRLLFLKRRRRRPRSAPTLPRCACPAAWLWAPADWAVVLRSWPPHPSAARGPADAWGRPRWAPRWPGPVPASACTRLQASWRCGTSPAPCNRPRPAQSAPRCGRSGADSAASLRLPGRCRRWPRTPAPCC